MKNLAYKDGYERYILKIIMAGESDKKIGLIHGERVSVFVIINDGSSYVL